MNLQQLYYFKEIAELEHYTKASKRLNISQSSLSHSINDLESELGVDLFSHQGRNVQLTKAGELFLTYVKRSLEVLDEGKNLLSDFISADKGNIAISYISSLFHFVPTVISQYFEDTGRVHTCFQFDESATSLIHEHLLSGTTDIAITTPFNNDDSIVSRKIGESPVVLAVPADHPLAKKKSVDLREIANEKFIAFGKMCQIRDYIDGVFESLDISPSISFEAAYDSIVLSAISIGLGVAIVPAASISSRNNKVVAVKISNKLPAREIHVAWVKDRYMSPAVKSFLDYILEHGYLLDEYTNPKA